MNLKRAKLLRRAAKENSIGMPSRLLRSPAGQLLVLGERGIYKLLKKGTERS